MKIRFYIVVYSLFVVLQLWGQPEAYFMHYGTENGLSQHTVTDILQDEKGFMWFSTWDGLSKFDGYTFTTYRLLQEIQLSREAVELIIYMRTNITIYGFYRMIIRLIDLMLKPNHFRP